MKKAKHIVIEGTEGVGKTTQVKLLIEALKSSGSSVLETKEPGSPHDQLTMDLRKVMLDASFDLPRPARELISQAIRSIHMEKVVKPALLTHDFIIQDRGILSGLAYGEACGNELPQLQNLIKYALGDFNDGQILNVYDKVIVLMGDAKKGLARAQAAKQEFEGGDAIESKGNDFMVHVRDNFIEYSKHLGNVVFIQVEGKTREDVLSLILAEINF